MKLTLADGRDIEKYIFRDMYCFKYTDILVTKTVASAAQCGW